MKQLFKKFEKYGFSGLRSVLFTSLLVSLVSIFVACYFLYKQNEPVNYYMSEDNENYLILPINSPILDVGRVREWSTSTLANVFTFDFIDVKSKMQTNKRFFTDEGWSSFNSELENNGLTKDVSSKNLIFKTSVCSLPVLSNREQNPKAFYLSSKWKFIIPIIINIEGASGVTRNDVFIVETDVRFLTDSELSERNGKTRDISILGIDAIKMKSANFTSYCKIPFS